jgi:hypothetical protein
MGLANLGLDTGIFCDFLYSVLPFNAFWGLGFLGHALSGRRRWASTGTCAGQS